MTMIYTQLTIEAVERLLDGWAQRGPDSGVAALLPEAEIGAVPMLQEACRARGLGLVGAIFPALIRDERFVREGGWLFLFERMPPHAILPIDDPDGTSLVARAVVSIREGLAAYRSPENKPTLFLCFDGMLPSIATMLDDIYLEVANRVEYAGVNAGSETFSAMPCLFDAERHLGEAALMMLLPGSFSPALAHGFRCPQRTMSATATSGNCIAMIDWRPAFDVYQEVIRSEYGIDLTPENFYEYAVHFPFGIICAGGDVVVRIPVALGEDGTLHCVGEIPENAMLVLLKAPPARDVNCVERLAERLRTTHGSAPGSPLIVYYCAGRRMHLGTDAILELEALKAETGAGEIAGALSLGEIGSTVRHAYPMFHNAALVCVPWGRE